MLRESEHSILDGNVRRIHYRSGLLGAALLGQDDGRRPAGETPERAARQNLYRPEQFQKGGGEHQEATADASNVPAKRDQS